MARMWPKSIAGSDCPESERDVFDALERHVGDEWLVFHSIGWSDLDPADGLRQGEIDFVLVHPDRGVIAVEVKGMGVTCEGGAWYRTHGSVRERTKDPFAQAIDHQYALRRILRSTPGLDSLEPSYGHCVIFPYTPMATLPPSADADLTIDRDAFRHEFGTRLAHIADRTLRGDGDPFDAAAILALQARLAPSFAPLSTLGDQVVDAVVELESLTIEQRAVLDQMEGTRFLDVLGFAGSGKTVLAFAKAKRLASQGKRVGYICFNRLLAQEKAEEHARVEGLSVKHFHSLASDLVRQARIPITYPGKGASAEQSKTFWEKDMPDAMRQAVDILGPQFDALVIDEGQDLSTRFFESLRATLESPEESEMWVFRDDNQLLFGRELELPPEFATRRLTVNCRNTASIHRELMRFYEGGLPATQAGPEGPAVEWIESEDQPATLLATLRRLRAEEVPLQDIVVLAPRPLEGKAGSAKASRVGRELRAAETEFKFASGRQAGIELDRVRFESMAAFKGLESPVVIVVEYEGLGKHAGDAASTYVALSRACALCVVIGAPGSLPAESRQL